MSEEKPGQVAEIRILPAREDGRYPVELRVLGGPHAAGTLQLDLADLAVDPEAYGRALGEALFASAKLRDAYEGALARQGGEGGGRLHVHLQIDPPELSRLHWERVFHPYAGGWSPLGSTAATPFSRYVPVQQWDRPGSGIKPPFRLLAVIASPASLDSYGLDPIDDEEKQALHHLLDGLPKDKAAVTYLETGAANPPTLDRLRSVLAGGYHLVHFLCHGAETEAGTVLYLEDAAGTVVPVGADQLVGAFKVLDKPPLLCFLAACESAARSGTGAFAPLGPALVESGRVQAVVAMTDKVTLRTAQSFTEQFYTRLLSHYLVDLAANEARAAVHGKWDWGVPVLFSQLPDNRLSAADPVRTALQLIRRWRAGGYIPMPLDVVHLVQPQGSGKPEWFEERSEPSSELAGVIFRILGDEPARRPGKLVVLIGGHGMARSTQLWRIARATAEHSLSPDAKRQVIPLYIDLSGYPSVASGTGNRIEALMLDSLRRFWPDLTAATLSELLQGKAGTGPPGEDGPVVQILLDGSDDLPDRQRQQAWQEAQAMGASLPHDCVLAIAPRSFDPQRLKDADDLLVIQPLSRAAIEQFLTGLDDHGRRLRDALRDKQLFDLAASSSLLIRMLDQVRKGICPQSRHQVLCDLVDDGIATIRTERGMRSHAAHTLNRLAWEMQSTRSGTWKMKDLLETMADVRGNREYNLEELFDGLVRCDLLARVGEDEMRFAFPSIQAYCCAQAIAQREDRDRVLDDIAASLGRLDRLRWWEETLVLLSGLSDDPNTVLRALTYGTDLTQGEQVYLVVRCLLESGVDKADEILVKQALDALIWRLDSATEPRSSRRVRAIRALGQLRHPSAIPYLARLANQQVRPNREGNLDYELSGVRMAASVVLHSMMPEYADEISRADKTLAGHLQLWLDGDVTALTNRLLRGKKEAQSLAAFALGGLRTQEAADTLIAAFFSPKTDARTRWALTEAVALLDPDLVVNRVILPLLDAGAARKQGHEPSTWYTWRQRAHWYERLAYLIGKIRTQDETAHRLLDDCIVRFTNVDLKGKAIQALGRLNDRQKKGLFEQVAMDKAGSEQFKLREDISEPEKRYLRRTAIEALAKIGDEETVKRLSQKQALGLHFELQQAIYRAREEIAWRTSLSESQEAGPQAQMAWLRLLRGHHFDPFYFRMGDDDSA